MTKMIIKIILFSLLTVMFVGYVIELEVLNIHMLSYLQNESIQSALEIHAYVISTLFTFALQYTHLSFIIMTIFITYVIFRFITGVLLK